MTHSACTDESPSGSSRPPRLLVVTDRHQTAGPLPDVVAAAVAGGTRAVVLRDKDLPEPARCALARELAPIVHEAGGVLLTAGTLLPGADGVHEPSAQAARRTSTPGGRLTGRSCHDIGDVRAAEADDVSYVTVSPVYASVSKPGYGPALGTDGLAALVTATTIPVYALGGVDRPEMVAACRASGAHGVAVMGAVMRARRPATVVAELLAAAEAAPT